MSELELRQIFTVLQETEQELQQAGDCEHSRSLALQRLLELRKRMDQFVEFWLRFEDKVNHMQEKYSFSLPDELDDSVLHAFLKVVPDKVLERRKFCELALPAEQNMCIRSFRKALGFLELAMMEEAIAEFEKVVAMEPELLLARLCLGVAYAEKGLVDEAMRELRLVQALTEDRQVHAIIHNSLGNLYAVSERYELALPEFVKAVDLSPDFVVARFNLAASYYNLHKYEESLQHFLSVRECFPRDWEIYFYLGKAFIKLDNNAEALVNLLKAAYLAPGQYCVFLELGQLYEQLGETRKALEYCYRAHKLYLEEEQRQHGHSE